MSSTSFDQQPPTATIANGQALKGDPSKEDASAVGKTADAYWSENIRLLFSLLAIWFAVSFGAGILFVNQLNTIMLGGYPLGFWFAQQGSIYVFVVLIFFYAFRMKAIERRYGIDDNDV